MNKKLLWICTGVLVLTLVGCDCVGIKRLARQKHIYKNTTDYFYIKNQEISTFPQKQETNITNESRGNERITDITNELKDSKNNNGNGSKNKHSNSKHPVGDIGGSVLPGGKKRPFRIPQKNKPAQINSPSHKKSPSAPRARENSKNHITTRLEWIIYTEYPEQEEIPVPETILLDGVEVEQGDKISSGRHQIIVKHPGHETLRKNIFVPTGTKVHTFKGTMATLPRHIESDITYDISPPSSLGDTSIILISQRTGKTISLENTPVKPGEYQLKINKRGYLPISKMVRIYPIRSPYKIKEMLKAKPVKIRTIVNYDVQPPSNLQKPVAVFIGRNIQQSIIDGGNIKPGRYSYQITQPGYHMQGNEKQIDIHPSEEIYTIRENMNVQPRSISFDIEKDGFLVPLQEIFINGESVSFDKTFIPGKQYHLVAKFREYQTVKKTITIIPGEGPYRLNINLKRK